MDAVAGLLDGPRARGAFVLRSLLDPPWAIRIEDGAPLTLVAIVRGSACLLAGGETWLRAGDLAVLTGPDPYVLADRPGTPPQAVILPGQRCTTPDGRPLAALSSLGVRTWGNNPAGETVMISGTYEVGSEVSRRLLAALPSRLVLPGAEAPSRLLEFLADEVTRDEPGQEAVLDRLLDLVLIAALRTWFARADAPGWYRATADPAVGTALRLVQEQPERPWTVASLASAVGMSRAAFARRFAERVGESPIAFLTSWRMALAADLLREPGATVTSVARRLGYASPFALSAAFKRVRGVSPRTHQRAIAG